MRKNILGLACLLLSCAALFVGCSKGNEFAFEDGRYVDGKTQISYIDAPACYAPVAMGDEIYGTLGDSKFYRIVGADPEKWICEEGGTVLYAQGVELPTLGKMNISAANVMAEDVRIAQLTDTTISELVAVYEGAPRINKPMVTDGMLTTNWRIHFIDESLGIYYVLEYFEFGEDYVIKSDTNEEINLGRRFIYNRFEGVCVMAGEVLSELVTEYEEIVQ